MSAREYLAQGRLGDAIDAQIQHVKAHPTDYEARTTLALLSVFRGDLDRAARQLDAVDPGDANLQVTVYVLQSLVRSEMERREVFSGNGLPLLPKQIPRHAALRLEALESFRGGDRAAAGRAIDQAAEESPGFEGVLDGESVDGLRDYDDLLGSVLEIFAGGRYLWLPFEQVGSLRIPEPSTLMDLLWVPAEMTSREGETSHVHLPALYPGSAEHADEQVQLGRTTAWIDCDEVGYRGAGQHILLSGRDGETVETPVLSLRTVSARSDPIAQETPAEGDA